MRQQQQMMTHVIIWMSAALAAGQALQTELAIVMDPSRMPDTIVQEIVLLTKMLMVYVMYLTLA